MATLQVTGLDGAIYTLDANTILKCSRGTNSNVTVSLTDGSILVLKDLEFAKIDDAMNAPR